MIGASINRLHLSLNILDLIETLPKSFIWANTAAKDSASLRVHRLQVL